MIVFSIMHRAKGNDFFGFITSATLRRAVCTAVMAASLIHDSLAFFPLMGLLWLWIAPATGPGLTAVHGDKEALKWMMKRQLYAAPSLLFYAIYCGKLYLMPVALLSPLIGYAYYAVRKAGEDKSADAEWLAGAIMGALMGVITHG